MATPVFGKMLNFGSNLSAVARCSQCRLLCSSSAPFRKEIQKSFRDPMPGLKPPKHAVTSGNELQTTGFNTKVTTLQNGMRVATRNMHADYCILGVLIDSGSRYEVNYTSGVNHFLSKLAFNKTTQYSSSDHIKEEVEKVGGVINSQNSRDTMIYLMATDRAGVPTALNILAEAVLRPEITEEELNHAKQTIAFELEAIDMNPIPDTILTELIFAAGYRNNTLGLPSICPAENIEKMDIKTIYTYLSNFYDPKRIVLTGVGCDHEEFLQQAEEIFLSKEPIWNEDRIEIDQNKGCDDSVSQYTGGIVTLEKDLSNISLGPTPMPDLAHVMIGLESCSHQDEDFVGYCVLNSLLGGGSSFSSGGPGKGMFSRLYLNVLNRFSRKFYLQGILQLVNSCSHQDEDFVGYCVLNSLLGGGSSFSSGGPGKGMYSRLYLNVLNRHYYINDAVAYNNAFADSGLFCIHGSSPPEQLGSLVDVITKELVNTTGRITEEEINRAKRSLQSFYLMNLEQKIVVMEDVGRQVLSQNMRHEAEYYYDKIGSITVKDVHRVAERMLSSNPAVAAYGNLKKLPNLDRIKNSLKQSKLFSLFGH